MTLGDSKVRKWRAKVRQMVPKGSQKIAKGNQKGAKGSQKGAKGRPKCIQKSIFGKGHEKGAERVTRIRVFGSILVPIFHKLIFPGSCSGAYKAFILMGSCTKILDVYKTFMEI